MNTQFIGRTLTNSSVMLSDEPELILTREEFLALEKTDPQLAAMAEIRMVDSEKTTSRLRYVIRFNSFINSHGRFTRFK